MAVRSMRLLFIFHYAVTCSSSCLGRAFLRMSARITGIPVTKRLIKRSPTTRNEASRGCFRRGLGLLGIPRKKKRALPSASMAVWNGRLKVGNTVGSSQDGPKRKHLPRMFSLIKNGS